jgi:hypothetical protein
MDLQQIAQTTFVLLEATWPVSRGRELVEALNPTHVIVHRHDPQQYYYLYTREEALGLFHLSVDTYPIQQAFHLHKFDATPLLEAHSNAEDAPDRCIIHEGGKLIGFFDATVPPAIRSRRRGLGEPEPAEVVDRSVIAEFPDRVELGVVTSLLVSLTASEAGSSGVSVAGLPLGTTVDIVVQARRGFALEGRGEGSLKIADEQETLPLQFKLRSTALGLGQIRVLVLHDGVALGAMTLAPTVIEQPADTQAASPRSHEQALAPVSVRLPDLSLLIEEVWDNGRRAFTLRITSSNPNHNLYLTKFGPIFFQKDPGPYFQDLYEDIEGYAVATPTDRAITSQKLAAKGAFLFRTLLPSEVQGKLWELKDQITSVLVQSEEPWIPWELCKLSGRINGRVVDGPFLCEAFACTRWIPGSGGLQPALTLRNMAIVVPSDSRLPFAATERAYLLSLAQGARKVTGIPARFLDLQRALASGEYDGWHFTGHGSDIPRDPNQSVMYLERQETFTPEQIVGEVSNLGQAHPLVFLNACQIGRSGMALTDIGGWAKQFLEAGAGAFIGAYWSVYDQPACDFSREVYSRLLAGLPIGWAVQEARLAIKAAGDPTWLAYTVFADPFATVQTSN